jgi:hypothetical protein
MRGVIGTKRDTPKSGAASQGCAASDAGRVPGRPCPTPAYWAGLPQRHAIQDDAGLTYYGLPAVGLAVQRYVNGNVGGVLANYGGLNSHRYERLMQ